MVTFYKRIPCQKGVENVIGHLSILGGGLESVSLLRALVAPRPDESFSRICIFFSSAKWRGYQMLVVRK